MKTIIFLGKYRVYKSAFERLLWMANLPTSIALDASRFTLNTSKDNCCQLSDGVLANADSHLLSYLPLLAETAAQPYDDIQVQRQQLRQINDDLVTPSEVLLPQENDNYEALTTLILRLSRILGLPLQVRANNFNDSHRHFPIRRPKNIASTALYFQTQCLDLKQPVLVERIYQNHFHYVAVVQPDKQANSCLKLFGINDDHGVLQDIFEDKVLQCNKNLSQQLSQLIDLAIATFSPSGVFSLYFSASAEQILFSHINTSVDMPIFLSFHQALMTSGEVGCESQSIAARLVYKEPEYDKLFRHDAKALTENKISMFDIAPASFVKFLEHNEKQLDYPFGVTIARNNDVRQALRQAIRYENLLSGRLDSY